MSRITAILVKELRKRTGTGIMDCKKALIEANGDIELAIANMRKLGQVKAIKKSGHIAAEGVIMAEVSTDGKLGALLELNCETDFAAKDMNFIIFGNKALKAVMANKLLDVDELNLKLKEQRAAVVAKIGENINIRRIKVLEGEKIGHYLHGVRIGVLISMEGTDDNDFARHIAMHIAASRPEYLTPKEIPVHVIANESQIQFDIAMKSAKSRKIAEKIVAGRMSKFVSEISLMEQQFIMDSSKTVAAILKEKNAKVIDFVRFEVGEGIKKVKTNFVDEVAAMIKS